jgi:hypothetical protein
VTAHPPLTFIIYHTYITLQKLNDVADVKMAETGDQVPDLKEIHDSLIDLALQAGEIITTSLPRIDSTGSKKNSEYMYILTTDHQRKPSEGRYILMKVNKVPTWSPNMTELWKAWSPKH